MPKKLRRLSGKAIIRIFEGFGFSLVRIRGSHHYMTRKVEEGSQHLNIPVHGNKPLRDGTIKSIYRQARGHGLAEEDLEPHFYTE